MSSVMQQAHSIINRLSRRRHGNSQTAQSGTAQKQAPGTVSSSQSSKSLVGQKTVGPGLDSRSCFSKFYLEKLANLDPDVELASANQLAVHNHAVVAARYAELNGMRLTSFRQKNELGHV